MSEIRELTAAALQMLPLPPHEQDSDKDARGRVLFIGGSSLCPGAALLSGIAALRGGAGKVLVATAKPIAERIGLMAPEFGVVALEATRHGEPSAEDEALDGHFDDCDAVLIGPGMMDVDNAQGLIRRALKHIKVPLVLDAAAIPACVGATDVLQRCDVPRVLTPHAGEMARLMNVAKQAVQDTPVPMARGACQEWRSTIILKAATTYIVGPGHPIWRHSGGSCGLATAGSGDTLAGLVSALLARGASAQAASAWGVLVHAQAGRMLASTVGPIGFMAGELPGTFPRLLQRLAAAAAPAAPGAPSEGAMG